MKKVIISSILIFLLAIGLIMNFAPDALSQLIIGVMIIVMTWGYLFGILPTALFLGGFITARRNLRAALNVQASSVWLVVQGYESVFRQRQLDQLFADYRSKVNSQIEEESTVPDIAEYINEEGLSLLSWQTVVHQIPGTLTALGLLGTFIGLIMGVSAIGFSSVDAALDSIAILLNGIRTAFYTSIAGVIFSILFNLIYRLLWNAMLREYGMFLEEFHRNVLPSAEEQQRTQTNYEIRQILEKLDRLPENKGLRLLDQENMSGIENQLPQLRDALASGEFVFYLQPKYDLNTSRIVGAEALMRWNHPKLGLILPEDYLPVLEASGYIARVDRYLWEQVCITIRQWMDSGIRPVPISVNISRTDILSMDLTAHFDSLLRKYQIPPRYLELEIASNAYTDCLPAALEAETLLRQKGLCVTVDGIRGEISELEILNHSHADSAKLDIRFAESIDTVKTMIGKVGVLGIPYSVVGIESAEQLSILRTSGCMTGQGYYFSKPLPVKEFIQLTERNV